MWSGTVGAEPVACLAETIDPQDYDIAGCGADSGVGIDLIQRAVPARAGQLAHVRMIDDRVKAGMLFETPNVGPDRGQALSRCRA